MKIHIEDTPVDCHGDGGTFQIRLVPETVVEVTQLERPFSVDTKPGGYVRVVMGDRLSYVVTFASYNRPGPGIGPVGS